MKTMTAAAVAVLMLAGCGGAATVTPDSPEYSTKADGLLSCGTYTAPGSVTPSCSSAAACVCDWMCVENSQDGSRHAVHADFVQKTDAKGAPYWEATSTTWSAAGC